MKITVFKKSIGIIGVLLSIMFVVNCSSDDSGSETSPSSIVVTASVVPFGEVDVLSHSTSQNITVKGNNLTTELSISATENFQISIDDSNFSNQLTISKDAANEANQTLYIRFSPSVSAIGSISGEVSLQSDSATTQTVNLAGIGLSIAPIITVGSFNIDFEDTGISQQSDAMALLVNGGHLNSVIDLIVSEGFEISLDDTNYALTLQIPLETVNNQNTIYVRFVPTIAGNASGTLTLSNADVDDVEVALTGVGLPVIHNYLAFNNERLAFGGSYNQSSTQTFNLHDDLTNIETIKMFVKLSCPAGGCDEWDVYANVKVKDETSGELYELGRYITPYWNDNSQLDRGFEFDVTDFKSLLTGATELRIRTECWNDKGYEVTVDFDYIEGTPDYPYYAISRILAYDDWSSSGVPYGVNHSFDLDKMVSIPANSESTHLRTIISGWGHATPNDSDGRPCAEWCYRTHDVLINGMAAFQHDLAPLGCASNPVSNQNPGNWQPNRAGWCPGMVVPVRLDQFESSLAGDMFEFEYDYEDWVTDGGNGNAFYATSTFVVVKSNTPIIKPMVTE